MTDYIGKMMFGFEYETLIQIIQEINVDEMEDEEKRYRLADAYNSSQLPKIRQNFKYSPRYGAPGLSVTSSIPNTPDSKSWVVCHDGSVTLTQKRALFTKFYENIYSFATKQQHNDLLQRANNVLQHVEIVSPILYPYTYRPIFDDIFTHILPMQNGLFYFNNSKTSNHIHVSCGDEFRNPNKLFDVCMMWWRFEQLFLYLCPKWRRENRYCLPMQHILEKNFDHNYLLQNFMTGYPRNNVDLFAVIETFQGNPLEKSNRYAAFNMLNLAPGGIGTVEIRIKHGSTDYMELSMFIELFINFLNACLNNKKIDSQNDLWLLYASKNNPALLPQVLNVLFDKIIDNTTLRSYFITQLQYIMSMDDSTMPGNSQLVPMNIGGEKKILLFNYGSNNVDQIKSRAKIQESIELEVHSAYILDYVRIFAGYSERWKGGIATLYPKKTKRTYGYVVELTKNQIELIDQYEGGYSRVEKQVVINDKRPEVTVNAFVYIKNNDTFVQPPSKDYLNAIRMTLNNCTRNISKKIAIRKKLADGKIKTLGYY